MLWFSPTVKSVNTHLKIHSSVRYAAEQIQDRLATRHPVLTDGRATPN